MWIWGRHFMLCYLYPGRNESNGPVWYCSALWDSSPLLGSDLTWLEGKVRRWGWKYGFLEVTMMGMLVLIISLIVSLAWSLSWGIALHTWIFSQRCVFDHKSSDLFPRLHMHELRLVPSTLTFINHNAPREGWSVCWSICGLAIISPDARIVCLSAEMEHDALRRRQRWAKICFALNCLFALAERDHLNFTPGEENNKQHFSSSR